MGFFLSQTLFKYSLLLPLLFLVLLSSSSSSSSSSVLHDQTKPLKITGSVVPDRYRQVFHIKNTSPFFLDRPVAGNKKMRNKIMAMKTTTTTMTMTMTMMRKKIKNTETNRPNFSVMLPKGFVPPSGSSPCHNENPNSVVFFCQLATPSEP